MGSMGSNPRKPFSYFNLVEGTKGFSKKRWMRKRYLGEVYQGTLGAGSDVMVVQQSGSGEEWVNQTVAEALAQMRSGRDVKRGVESGVHHPDLTTMLRYAAPERLASSPTKPRSPFASSSPPAAATVVTATAGKGQGGMEAADVFAFKVVVFEIILGQHPHYPRRMPASLVEWQARQKLWVAGQPGSAGGPTACRRVQPSRGALPVAFCLLPPLRCH
ncbi:unnamed protein product [Closterium sp. NIES-64]|nr:unnamed protein product [Closterium sp. NIES-64]